MLFRSGTTVYVGVGDTENGQSLDVNELYRDPDDQDRSEALLIGAPCI